MSEQQGSGPGLGDLLGKFQEVQRRMQEMQERLAGLTAEAESGGGMVRVVANGKKEVLSIEIEPELLSPDERGMLQDLVRAAVNAALEKAERVAREQMEQSLGQLTGGMLPQIFGQ